MGQQQLLLIVLGVIIVGIAVVVGINLFNANAETSTQDSIVSQGTNIGALAQQYYKKPVSMGGGGGAFDHSKGGVGFQTYFNTLPNKLITSTDATWAVTEVTPTQVTLTATPVDYNWTVVTTVTDSTIVSSVNN